MSGVQIMMTHGMADGEFGLSIDDIVYSYYGNRTGTTLESKLNGSMKDKAPPAIRMELIKWARTGAVQKDWDNGIQQKIQTHCALCHNQSSSLPDFSQLETLQALAEADTGQSIARMTALSHIHLFGISFIFMLMGLIFVFSIGLPQWFKGVLVITPFAFLILDIISWWVTKYFPGFALVTIIGGVGYSLASTAMLSISLYQMWMLPWLLSGDGRKHALVLNYVNTLKTKIGMTDFSLNALKNKLVIPECVIKQFNVLKDKINRSE
jgi:hypothetical protein